MDRINISKIGPRGVFELVSIPGKVFKVLANITRVGIFENFLGLGKGI